MTRIAAFLVLLLAACSRGSSPAPVADHKPEHIDSVVPHDVALAKFRADLPEVKTFTGGASSRDALVKQFITALETSDTSALRALALTKAEYAWLYYPTNPQGLPPYDLNADLYWFMLSGNGNKGLSHLITDRMGTPLKVTGYLCEGESSKEGENTLWGPCVLRRLQAPGDTLEERLFSQIIERRGVFKFVSFANKL